MQENLTIANGAITGKLKYISTGALATDWGAGNFMALKFTPDEDAEAVYVGLDPSVSSGLVALDDDLNGVFKVTNKDTQKFVVKSVKGTMTTWQYFDLSGLTVVGAGA